MRLETVPAHVPDELVIDFDYLDMRGATDVYLWFKQLHEGPDIFFTPRHGGHWVVTRYDDMQFILQNNVEFSSQQQTVPKEGKPFPIPLLEYDEPLHTDFRNLLAPFFGPRAIVDLESKARNLIVSLIDGFRAKGECDFTREFALRMPVGIFMSVLDLPATDTPYLLQISEDVVRGQTPEVQQAAFARVFAYIGEILDQRQAHPGCDLLSALTQGTVEGGRRLTKEELMGLGALLIIAGLDTVAAMLGFITLFLARNPAHRQQLVDDPTLINDALEELMRRHHIANVARMVLKDMTYKGIGLRAGDLVLVPTTVAGLDERRFPDPLTVDFRRRDKKHLVLGRGVHQCIGAFLARTELRVFLAEWLKRIPDFSVKPGAQPDAVPGRANTVRYLPLVWQVR